MWKMKLVSIFVHGAENPDRDATTYEISKYFYV